MDHPEEMLHAFHADFLRPDFDFEGMILIFTDQAEQQPCQQADDQQLEQSACRR